jgi:copper chaperone
MIKTLEVKGMTCGHCEKSVKNALEELNGVQEAQVDLSTGKVNVTYDAATVTVETMYGAVEEQGYDVVKTK